MKKINTLLRKCKSIGALGRSSSYSSLRSNSTKEDFLWEDFAVASAHEEQLAVVLVGRTRRRYAIKSKYLSHPLLAALIDPSSSTTSTHGAADGGNKVISVRCEVVLFDHLLWMLENTQLDVADHDGSTLQELAELYAC